MHPRIEVEILYNKIKYIHGIAQTAFDTMADKEFYLDALEKIIAVTTPTVGFGEDNA